MSRILPGAIVLGIALSGFFDGILLHQILQWHHLLSLVDGYGLEDPRVQILADGAFHILMYVLTAVGLVMLWRARRELAATDAARRLGAGLLLGFGVWNIADIVVFHWLVGIHRLRLDGPDPLPWDVGWLVALGLVPLFLGWLALRRRSSGGGGGVRAASLAGLLVVVAGGLAMRPAEGGYTAILFAPGSSQVEVLSAIAGVDGRLVALDRSGELAVVKLPPGERGWRLYRTGALVVGSAGPAGCMVSPRWSERGTSAASAASLQVRRA